ncbi:P-II family nitrogen regulator [Amycolatopsis pithecellobii]|uniref:Uncharacterized protein n=1 Tax=Amycolatopsis pithecellobii TaxID=664692 RepID=A0A6N7YX85_9PSEU|nr:P-II family nitrogen regulator [Amycolatopsis pithecellobii]MTD56542.1 hypothetical protein [Amycolatopsis pithecellobii]
MPQYSVDLSAKVRVEILPDDDLVDQTLTAGPAACRTGRIGEGKVWVTPVDTIVRVCTGELARRDPSHTAAVDGTRWTPYVSRRPKPSFNAFAITSEGPLAQIDQHRLHR